MEEERKAILSDSNHRPSQHTVSILGVPRELQLDNTVASTREGPQHCMDKPESFEAADCYNLSTFLTTGKDDSSCTSNSVSANNYDTNTSNS